MLNQNDLQIRVSSQYGVWEILLLEKFSLVPHYSLVICLSLRFDFFVFFHLVFEFVVGFSWPSIPPIQFLDLSFGFLLKWVSGSCLTFHFGSYEACALVILIWVSGFCLTLWLLLWIGFLHQSLPNNFGFENSRLIFSYFHYFCSWRNFLLPESLCSFFIQVLWKIQLN